MTFRYDSDAPTLGPLSPFIIDLDMDSTTAIACIEYRYVLAKMHLLFDLPQPPVGMEPQIHFLSVYVITYQKFTKCMLVQ